MEPLHSKYRNKRARSHSKRSKQLQGARSKLLNRKAAAEEEAGTVSGGSDSESELPFSESESQPEASKPGRTRDKFSRFDITTAIDLDEDFVLVHVGSLSQVVSGLKCKFCDSDKLQVTLTDKKGFAFKIVVKCQNCDETSGISSSPRVCTQSQRPPFEVNRKMVQAFLHAGAGFTAMQRFGVCMGMQVMTSPSYRNHLMKLVEENVELKQAILKLAREAVRQAYISEDPTLLNEETIDVAVTFDGSWHKRGHTSLYGFVSVIEIVTGLVVDYETLSKYCHTCRISAAEYGEDSEEFKLWHEQHLEMHECNQNYDSSSGNMERDGAVIIWKRSVAEAKMRYLKYVSDGDAKSLSAINEAKPYGDDIIVEKDECTNHVGKRLGTALRNVVSDSSKRGVTLGGKQEGALTQVKIDKLQGYYQKALMDNAPNVENMRRAILATPHHYASTSQKPRHQYCPDGKDSWCFWKKAKAEKPKCKPNHQVLKTTINEKVFNAILPVYERLSSLELMEKCKKLLTQNSNESLHNVVWSKVPKITFIGKGRLDLGVTQAVGEFNMGVRNMLALEGNITDRPSSSQSMRNADQLDARRLDQSDHQSKTETKKARSAKKKAKKNKKSKKDCYSAGGGD